MAAAAGFCQLHLALALAIALAVGLAAAFVAMGAALTFAIMRRCPVCFAQRMAAAMAKRVAARFQAMAHGNALVKNETFALPFAGRGRHLFKIFQNASFEMEYILKTMFFKISSSLLTPYSTSTEHSDFFVFLWV